MKPIQTLEELRHNMDTLDQYLDNKTERTYSFALELVKKGVCFVVCKGNGKTKFYPSRFIGYADNTMSKHLSNDSKDGKVTNPAISKLLDGKPVYDPELESAYQAYCESLGFTANGKGTFGVMRKYWKFY